MQISLSTPITKTWLTNEKMLDLVNGLKGTFRTYFLHSSLCCSFCTLFALKMINKNDSMSSFIYHSVCVHCGCENNLNILYVHEICKLWNIVWNCKSEADNENLRVTCFFFLVSHKGPINTQSNKSHIFLRYY